MTITTRRRSTNTTTTMTASAGYLLFIALSINILGIESASFQELAADFGSTPAEVLSLGGLFDQDCTFAFNATSENCDSLIELYETQQPYGGECGCYNFCNGQNVGCFAVGETPERFQCDIHQVVAGCQKGVEKNASPLSPKDDENSKPCPPGYMCTKDAERSCEEIRQIPIDLGLGDIHAGLICPGRDDRLNNNYEICPVGFYCPDSTTRIPCPEGYFCPPQDRGARDRL